MRVVVDCNVLIAAGLTNGMCRKVLTWILEHHHVLISEETCQEYAQVIQRDKFLPYRSYLQEFLVLICEIGHLIKEPSSSPYSLPDKDDEKYLAAASAGNAHYLITGNKKHFPQDSYGSIIILSPTEFHAKFIDIKS